jgi:O-antigen/teichoic acid export membrane protein
MIRRTAWAVGDQALSSATNFALVVMAARTLSRAGFGGFAIALAVYAVALGLSRAVCSEPLAVRSSTSDIEAARVDARAALGAAVVTGLAAAGVTALVTGAIGGAVAAAGLPLALAMPALLLQDAWRYACITVRRPADAFASDATWAIVQTALFVVVASAHLGAGGAVGAWGGGALAGSGVAWIRSGLGPQPHRAREWVRTHRELWPRYAAEFVAAAGGWQMTLVAVAAFGNLAAVGALRGAQALVGPLNVFFLAVPLVGITEGARLWRSGRAEPRKFAAWLSAGLATLAVLWGAALAALPAGAGRALLGATWPDARALWVPIVIVMAGVGAGLGALAGLRVVGDARASLAGGLTVAPLTMVASVTGAWLGGTRGAAWGWAIASVIGVGIWWRQLARAGRSAPHGSVIRDPVDVMAVAS